MGVRVLMNRSLLPVTVHYISCFRGSRDRIFPNRTDKSRHSRAASEQHRHVDKGGDILRGRSGGRGLAGIQRGQNSVEYSTLLLSTRSLSLMAA